MKDINDAIKEYRDALEQNLQASKIENQAKDLKRKAYYRLMRAKEAMRGVERDLFEDMERL